MKRSSNLNFPWHPIIWKQFELWERVYYTETSTLDLPHHIFTQTVDAQPHFVFWTVDGCKVHTYWQWLECMRALADEYLGAPVLQMKLWLRTVELQGYKSVSWSFCYIFFTNLSALLCQSEERHVITLVTTGFLNPRVQSTETQKTWRHEE